MYPALPSTDKTKVSQPQHRLCAEPDNSLLLDKPCACTTFNNLPGLCPLAASNTAPRVITMKGPDPTSCPQGERGVGGKTHPQLRGTEFKKKKKKLEMRIWSKPGTTACSSVSNNIPPAEIRDKNRKSFFLQASGSRNCYKNTFRKANLESSLQARSPTHTSH